jgi:TonB family protein
MLDAPRHAESAVASLGPPIPVPAGGRPRAALGRFWYPRPPIWPSLLSAAVHVAVVAALVWTVGDVLDRPHSEGQLVSFIPPPPRNPSVAGGGGEHIAAFASLAYFSGIGTDDGANGKTEKTDRHATRRPSESEVLAPVLSADTASTAGDNVYTSFEVDNAVQFSYGSAVPQYPPDLLARRVPGKVTVRFVVDTSGVADVQSLQIIDASDPQFAASVRDALPRMKFQPARLNGKRVRQLVEQPFRFNIDTTTPNPQDSATE